MPIEGVSDVIRLPRIAKIHLGEKVEDGEKRYCRALPYFVCPTGDQPGAGLIQDYYKTDKPIELDIVFPTEDREIIASQYLKVYHESHGLVCIGNGKSYKRKIDLFTGGIANRNTTEWEWRGRLDAKPGDDDFLPCNRQDCPEFLGKECKNTLCLQFILPFVRGIGVWQLDTASFYSIVNVNSMFTTLQDAAKHCGGRGISWVPLKLKLGPMDVFPPGMKKKKVNVLHIIRQDISLVELMQPAKALMLPGGVVLQPVAEAIEVAKPDDAEAPPEFAKDGFIESDQESKSEGTQAPSAGNLLEEWAKLRKVQADCNREHKARMTVKLDNPNVTIEDLITDGMVKTKLKQQCPQVKFTSGKLSDLPPQDLTATAVRQCRTDMEAYIKRIATPIDLPGALHTTEKPPEAAPLTTKPPEATELAAAATKTPETGELFPETHETAPEKPPEDLGVLWDAVRNLVKELKTEEKGLQTWWSQYGLQVTSIDFTLTDIPDKFSYDQLRNFHQNLIEIKAQRESHKHKKAEKPSRMI